LKPRVRRTSAALGILYHVLAVLAALLLLAMVVVVSGDILLRNISRAGISWANEVSEYALYLTTLLAAPWLLRRGGHVRVDLVLGMVPARTAWLMELVADVVGLIVCLVLVRYGLAMTLDSWRTGSITIKNLVFPEWWLLAPLPVIFLLLAIEFMFRFRRLFGGEKAPRADAISAG
jgi:TRAP-type C4-dicarboxylate transport system permease small subunit